MKVGRVIAAQHTTNIYCLGRRNNEFNEFLMGE